MLIVGSATFEGPRRGTRVVATTSPVHELHGGLRALCIYLAKHCTCGGNNDAKETRTLGIKVKDSF